MASAAAAVPAHAGRRHDGVPAPVGAESHPRRDAAHHQAASAVELPDDLPSKAPTQLELAIQAEDYERYRAALKELRQRDRELILARIEGEWSAVEIATYFGFTSVEAARMAIMRATRQLARLLESPSE